MQRGQIAIFTIVALVIIAGAIVYVFFGDNFLQNKNLSKDLSPLNDYLTETLDQVSLDGINFIILHGGYYHVPDGKGIVYFFDQYPYYYLDGQKIVPSLQTVQNELSSYIQENFQRRTNFSKFEEQGFNISIRNLSANSKISQTNVKVNLDTQIFITRGENLWSINSLSSENPSEIFNLRNIAEEITDSYIKMPGYICIDCIDKISSDNFVSIKAVPVEDVSIPKEDIIWFTINNFEKNKEWRFIVEQ